MPEMKTMTTQERATSADLLYGIPAIARYLDMREPQVRHLCERGEIPTFRMGRIICSSARRSTSTSPNGKPARPPASAREAKVPAHNDGSLSHPRLPCRSSG
jgi:hypothetical protein